MWQVLKQFMMGAKPETFILRMLSAVFINFSSMEDFKDSILDSIFLIK